MDTNAQPQPQAAPQASPVAAEPVKVLTEGVALLKSAPATNVDKAHLIGGVSIKGIIAVLVILAVCVMSVMKAEIKEPLYTLVGLIVGTYFGQNHQKEQ